MNIHYVMVQNMYQIRGIEKLLWEEKKSNVDWVALGGFMDLVEM